MENVKFPSIDAYATGRNMKRIARSRNAGAEDVRKALGIGNKSTVYKWFRGDVLPSIDNLVAFGFVFGATLDEIVATTRSA